MWGICHVKSEKFHVIYMEKRKWNELRPSCSGKLIVVAVQLLFDSAFAFEISYIYNDLNFAYKVLRWAASKDRKLLH